MREEKSRPSGREDPSRVRAPRRVERISSSLLLCIFYAPSCLLLGLLAAALYRIRVPPLPTTRVVTVGRGSTEHLHSESGRQRLFAQSCLSLSLGHSFTSLQPILPPAVLRALTSPTSQRRISYKPPPSPRPPCRPQSCLKASSSSSPPSFLPHQLSPSVTFLAPDRPIRKLARRGAPTRTLKEQSPPPLSANLARPLPPRTLFFSFLTIDGYRSHQSERELLWIRSRGLHRRARLRLWSVNILCLEAQSS
jgi:hypothetical protein